MKTVNELRDILSNQLDMLENNRTTIQRAQTVANLVGKFLHSIRLQLEYTRLKQTLGKDMSIPSLENKAS